MKTLLIIIALLFLGIAPAKAQSSKAEKAIECSAIYQIPTAAFGGKHPAAKAFMSL